MKFTRILYIYIIGFIILLALTTTVYPIDAWLQWKANKEPDLKGYQMYIMKGSFQDPSTDTRIIRRTPVNNEILYKNLSTIRFKNSSTMYVEVIAVQGRNPFYVTAINTRDLESGGSNVVVLTAPDGITNMQVIP